MEVPQICSQTFSLYNLDQEKRGTRNPRLVHGKMSSFHLSKKPSKKKMCNCRIMRKRKSCFLAWSNWFACAFKIFFLAEVFDKMFIWLVKCESQGCRPSCNRFVWWKVTREGLWCSRSYKVVQNLTSNVSNLKIKFWCLLYLFHLHKITRNSRDSL